MRNNSTLAEVLLWNQIKQQKLDVDFHRQKPIDEYIVDLYCPDLLLAVEVDGNMHRFKAKKDLDR